MRMTDDISHTLNLMNENIRSVIGISEKLAERIKLLEIDLQERVVKKKFFVSLVTFYPLIMIVLLGLLNVDHKKISAIAKDVNDFNLSMQAASVIEPAKNDDASYGEQG